MVIDGSRIDIPTVSVCSFPEANLGEDHGAIEELSLMLNNLTPGTMLLDRAEFQLMSNRLMTPGITDTTGFLSRMRVWLADAWRLPMGYILVSSYWAMS